MTNPPKVEAVHFFPLEFLPDLLQALVIVEQAFVVDVVDVRKINVQLIGDSPYAGARVRLPLALGVQSKAKLALNLPSDRGRPKVN